MDDCDIAMIQQALAELAECLDQKQPDNPSDAAIAARMRTKVAAWQIENERLLSEL